MNKIMELSSISKYHGLKMLEDYGLPHPSWLFAKTQKDIPEEAWAEAPWGWTIRSCPRTRYEFGLPSQHYLKYKQLPKVLQALSDKTHISDFVIYPSWEFDLSGCLLLSLDNLVVEVVVGDIAQLLRGRKTPDAVYGCAKREAKTLTLVAGSEDLLSASDKSQLVDAAWKIWTEYVLVLEWTKTTESKIFFHDLLKLRQNPWPVGADFYSFFGLR